MSKDVQKYIIMILKLLRNIFLILGISTDHVISLHTLRDKLLFYCITSKPSITQTEQL